MTDRYADRLARDLSEGDDVDVGLKRPHGDVEPAGSVDWLLFLRAAHIAEAYLLHVLPSIDVYGYNELVKAQCETLVDEIAFVSEVVNDDVLREELVVLHDAALTCIRSPYELLLVLEGP